MSIDTTKISEDEEATLAYTLNYIRFVKKTCGKSIEELLERELTEQIERSNAKIAESESEYRQYKASIREANKRALKDRRKIEDLERKLAAATSAKDE